MGNKKKDESEVLIMPRGRYMYGPGFWKGPDWFPGSGGFRGGWPGRGPGWGPCPWRLAGPGAYYGPAFSSPEGEKAFLNEQKEQLKEELNELEQRMAELEES